MMQNIGIDKGSDGSGRTGRVLLAFALVLMLAVPVVVILASIQDRNGGEDLPDPSRSNGDGSMSDESRSLWNDFLSDADPLPIGREDQKDWVSQRLDLNTRDSMPGYDWANGSYAGGNDKETDTGSDGLSDDDRSEPPTADDEQNGDEKERELEESDIVKAVQGILYVLNPYRGLMVINMSDPSKPFVEGRAYLPGMPISMYIVDFLGFVIVSEAPALGSWMASSTGRLYVIDLTDLSDPVVVKAVAIEGYPMDSRRVGDVIYVISNKYAYSTYYEEDAASKEISEEGDVVVAVTDTVTSDDKDVEGSSETTHIVSIYFGSPSKLGEMDRETFKGTSGLVHASQTAIFVPQPGTDWENPSTVFRYIDITDPQGDIKVRGSIKVPGFLGDRYQMDHYKSTFRVVTQKWPSQDRWSEFPMSTLYIVDCSDPDNMARQGSLLIDDEGNLMATRFAGDRGYTIHLPESIDPLDVLDLTDPADPKLTDVLEIPGWVEHLEVNGYDILAVGVDNEIGRNVAMYLFDVTDSDNAVLKDRVVIGTGSTYSDANYDPKALTILWDEGLVLLPFASYDWAGPYGGSTFGVQLISFDLEKGDLEKNGAFVTDEPVSRTRIVSGNIAGIGTTMLYSVDASKPGTPVIEAVLELAYYVQDAFPVDGKIVSLVPSVNWWGSAKSERCKIMVTSVDDPYRPVKVITVEGLRFMGMQRVGAKVLVKGISQAEGGLPVWELHRFDLSSPMDPVTLSVVKVPAELGNYYEPYPVYDDEYDYNVTEDEREGSEPGSSGKGEEGNVTPPADDDDDTGGEDTNIPTLSYDPMQWSVLKDGSVLLTNSYYGYYYYDYGYSGKYGAMAKEYSLIPWSSGSPFELLVNTTYMGYMDQSPLGTSARFLISYNNYYTGGTTVLEASFDGKVVTLERTFEVKGRVVGADSGLTRLYTIAEWNDDNGYHTTIGVYDIEDDPVFMKGADIAPGMSVVYMDDTLIVCAPSYWYYYRGGVLMDGLYDDMAISEEKGMPGYPDPDEQTYSLLAITLDGDGLFSGMTAHNLKGYWYLSFAQDRTVVLSSGQSASGLRFASDGSAEYLGPWTVYGSPSGGGV
ncbi:MAG: beta-propeller domain-containing protein, partial [Candidatus Thermoplasmatota archaeon]|nr:beta-propeller domain-containing protein [Candidatus Thermoplasmatota archaeon]